MPVDQRISDAAMTAAAAGHHVRIVVNPATADSWSKSTKIPAGLAAQHVNHLNLPPKIFIVGRDDGIPLDGYRLEDVVTGKVIVEAGTPDGTA